MISKSLSSSKLLGTATVLAAATTSSHGALAQITLTGNQISAIGGDTLNADLTGDGIDDISILANALRHDVSMSCCLLSLLLYLS